MTLVDAIVVYLSIGAPFGVLQTFARERRGILETAAISLLAMLAWPYLAISWSLGFFSGPSIGKQVPEQNQVGYDLADLFRISGHSNPNLAKVCYERGRRRISERGSEPLADGPDVAQIPPVVIEKQILSATSHH